MTVYHQQPDIGFIKWTGLHIQFAGVNYTIDDGYTDKPYAIWRPTVSFTQLVVYDEIPADFTANDCLVFLNKNGVATMVPGCTILDGDLIVPGSITAKAMAAHCITADHLYAGLISSGVIEVNNLGALTIAAKAILADHIHGATITGDLLVMDAITSREIAAHTITANEILGGTITTAELSAGSVEAINIKGGAITTEKLYAKAVTADKINVDDLFANQVFSRKLLIGSTFAGLEPPETPDVNLLWRNTSVSPNELLAWTGKATDNDRRYATSKEGPIVAIEDLSSSDGMALDVTVKTRAKQPTALVKVTNLALHGNFDATTGWNSDGGVVSVNANTGISTGKGNIPIVNIYQNLGDHITGHVYYMRAKVRVRNSECTELLLSSNSRNFTPSFVPVADTWYTLSGEFTATQAYPYGGIASFYSSAAAASGKILEVQYVVYIDLTATFGAGNEPSVAKKDSYLAPLTNQWFDGTTTLSLPAEGIIPSPTRIIPITPAIVAGGNANAKRYGKNLLEADNTLGNPGWATNAGSNPTLTTKDGIACIYSDKSVSHSRVKLEWDTSYTYSCRIMFEQSVVGSGAIDPLHCWVSKIGVGGVDGIATYSSNQYGTRTYEANVWYDLYIQFKTHTKAMYPDPIYLTPFIYTGDLINNNKSFWLQRAQIEVSSVLTDYEPYSGNDYALPVQQAMYGITGAEDERGSDGHETHKTVCITIPSDDNLSADEYIEGRLNESTVFVFTCPGLVGTQLGYLTSACSHFVNSIGVWDVNNTLTAYSDHPDWIAKYLRIANGFLGIVTTDSSADRVAKFKAWIAAQSVAGTPVTMMLRLSTPATVSNSETPIVGVDGTNTVYSDGAAVLVEYTGSGWTKVGDTNTVSSDTASALSKLLESITNDDRGLVITGIGGKYQNIVGPDGYELWDSGKMVVVINGQVMEITRVKVTESLQVGPGTFIFSNADGSGGIK